MFYKSKYTVLPTKKVRYVLFLVCYTTKKVNIMEKDFKNLGVEPSLISALTEQGFSAPTEIQSRAIPLILQGQDVVGLSQTGTGKTIAFVLPILQRVNEERYVQALVLCPTRELAEQILLEFKKIIKKDSRYRAVAVYGGADMQRQIYSLKRGANIVVGTPGRVLDHISRKTLKLGLVNTVVLDEADEMLNMGFRADIENILRNTPTERQTIMFSATMSQDILSITKNFMNAPKTIQIGTPNTTISNVRQTYFICPKDKKKRALHALLTELPRGRTIVFCNTKKMVDGVQNYLRKMGFIALALHGDMPQSVRKRVMNEYKTEPNTIMVTTDIAARGIDVKDIISVINFDLPQNLEYYIHRVGRTGRAGKDGNAYTLLNTPEQVRDLQEIEKRTKSKIILSQLTLNGLAEKAPAKQPARKGKKLNIKSREKRAILCGRNEQKQSRNGGRVNIQGNSKLGKKQRTIRQTHKSTKQSKIHF